MFILRSSSQRNQRSTRPKILIFLDGKCRITLKGGLNEVVDAGDIFILPDSCRHAYSSVEKTTDTRVYTLGLYFPQNILAPHRSSKDREIHSLMRKVLAGPAVLHGGFDLEMRHLVSDFRREYDESRTGSMIRMKSLCLSLLVVLARRLEEPATKTTNTPRNTAYLINEVKEFMYRAACSPISLGDIAWHVKMSEEHLARIFKKETDMTVMEYLRFLRVDAAKTYLLNSNDTIEALARRLGFGSTNPFCRTFKQATGQTPTEYRMSHAGARML